VRTEVTSASGKGEKAFVWILEVESDKQTFESMSDPGEFVSLDAKLAAALSKLAQEELGREIVQQQEIAAKSQKRLKGRQILWMVYQYYATSQDAGEMYSIVELMAVRLVDDKLETFMNNWSHVLAGMDEMPQAAVIEELFIEQLRYSKIMKDEIAHYDRHPKGHPDHTYEYMQRQVRAYLERTRKRANRPSASSQVWV
jgi:hypothetical protein